MGTVELLQQMKRANENPFIVMNWAIDDLENKTNYASEKFIKFLEVK